MVSLISPETRVHVGTKHQAARSLPPGEKTCCLWGCVGLRSGQNREFLGGPVAFCRGFAVY